MKYHFKLDKEDSGYSTECCELEGCITEGDTAEELYANCAEALDVYLYTAPDDTRRCFPLPDERLDGRQNIIAVPVAPDKEMLILSRVQPPRIAGLSRNSYYAAKNLIS
jgi:predicted RNase H-like HicB family nuclease